MTMGLTPRQSECLAVIAKALSAKGIAPSFDEIADSMRLKSKSGIDRLLKALEERGYIRRLPYRARGIALLDGKMLCPHCGNVAGGPACQDSAKRSAALLKQAIEKRLIIETPNSNTGNRPPWSAGARDAAPQRAFATPRLNRAASLAQSSKASDHE